MGPGKKKERNVVSDDEYSDDNDNCEPCLQQRETRASELREIGGDNDDNDGKYKDNRQVGLWRRDANCRQ